MDFSHLHSIIDDPESKISIKQCILFLNELYKNAIDKGEECFQQELEDDMRRYDGCAEAYGIALDLLTHVKNKKKPYESRALKRCPVCNRTSRQLEFYTQATMGVGNQRVFILCSCGRQTVDASSEIQARRNWNNDLVINAGIDASKEEFFSLDDDLDDLMCDLEEEDV